jgi:hypothetical protein
MFQTPLMWRQHCLSYRFYSISGVSDIADIKGNFHRCISGVSQTPLMP